MKPSGLRTSSTMIGLSLISFVSTRQGAQVTRIKESAGNASSVRLSESVGAHVLYVVAVAAFAAALPKEAFVAVSAGVIGTIGFLAMWRYGWGLLHFIRALVYRKWVFPRMREASD